MGWFFSFEKRLQVPIGDGFKAIVRREHGADIGVRDESREGTQEEGFVVRAFRAAAFGVGHRDNAVRCLDRRVRDL